MIDKNFWSKVSQKWSFMIDKEVKEALKENVDATVNAQSGETQDIFRPGADGFAKYFELLGDDDDF